MSVQNPLMQLMERYRKGNRPVFHIGPFLPLAAIRRKGLLFNEVFREAKTMTAAARISFEMGFESTVVPFDLNLEAEILGAGVLYHDGFEGHPVYPTISSRPVACAEDIIIPADVTAAGRMPAILETVSFLKHSDGDRGAVGVFMPGPFTLAGQVMEPECLFVMLLKQPDSAREILTHLTRFIQGLKAAYTDAGVDFMGIEEGGAAGISPRLFRRLLLPALQTLFEDKSCPMILSMTGGTDVFIDFLIACRPDGIGIDRECSTAVARKKIPPNIPLFTGCGSNDLLAIATPEGVTSAVRQCLSNGATTVGPPADIYPPARLENIAAFVQAIREY